MRHPLAMILLVGSSLASHYPLRQVFPVSSSLSDFPTAASTSPQSVSTLSVTASGAIPISTASSAKCGKGYTYCGYMLQSGGHNFAPEVINKTYCDALDGACVDGIPSTSTGQAVFLCMNDSPTSIQLFCACGGKCLNEASTSNIAHCDKPCVDGSKCS
ncbi:hypothetical protein BKA67DRAFT_220921 [Truncatella angustata]|uniref:Uncharacterized protein n=1 Tax=Truncatella angustata TaxID=152316 RepID=A0A9P9A243_9PEZI|nr:uncharacterized protein BKA67DRAFT_220921 [Truncatella angustata]KAH6658744.1 hypothetical protein BKA67DRAFT_220921 [Truncatella angustata]